LGMIGETVKHIEWNPAWMKPAHGLHFDAVQQDCHGGFIDDLAVMSVDFFLGLRLEGSGPREERVGAPTAGCVLEGSNGRLRGSADDDGGQHLAPSLLAYDFIDALALLRVGPSRRHHRLAKALADPMTDVL